MRVVLDVSNNSRISTGELRASGAVALIAKATEGSTFKDETLEQHRQAARHVGVPFGSYLFLRPASPGNEAGFYLDYAQPRPGDLQPIIDAETTNGHGFGQAAERVLACAHELERHGYRPILYASASFWQQLYRERPELRRLRVWEAQYPGRFDRWFPRLARLRIRLRHRASVVMWQFTAAYRVGSGRFDASILLTRRDTLLIERNP